MNQRTEVAVFGGGCFWCTEAVFERLKGVISVAPGYAGGTTTNPTYAQVCTGRTGHAEVAQVKYDPAQITYNDLLTVFFATHDPTSLNRQGADVGTEYRSVIFYTSEDQKRQAETFIGQHYNSDPRGRRVVTELRPVDKIYKPQHSQPQHCRNNF